ncbi:MAG: hypothetical protein Q8L80_07970 [Gallionella sp.]|nr:hypothetical protein [Gallionella sp.]MDP1941253.1 hypothetical protein [Gallionella sp.]
MNPETKPAPDFKYKPSAEYRFWLYDSEGIGMTYYWSKEKRDEAGNRAIQNYLDFDQWIDEVEYVCAGEVTHMAQLLNKRMRPDDLDEDEIDGDGISWADGMEWRGTYTLEPIPNPMLLDANGHRSIFDDIDK